jgi:hypothetical protein
VRVLLLAAACFCVSHIQAWVDGWEDVVRAVAGLARLPNELPAGSSLAA